MILKIFKNKQGQALIWIIDLIFIAVALAIAWYFISKK